MSSNLLTTVQAAALLNMYPDTLRLWRKQGKRAEVFSGRQPLPLFSQEALAEASNQHSQGRCVTPGDGWRPN